MSLQGDVRINQDGIVPSVLPLTNSQPFAVAVVDASGSQLPGFDASRPANTVISAFTYATGAVTILAANPARRGVIVFNATAKPVNVLLATGASASSFSFQIPTNGSWDSELNGYTGIVTAFWTAVAPTGAALHVTEIVT
jgi:hypothetical protein